MPIRVRPRKARVVATEVELRCPHCGELLRLTNPDERQVKRTYWNAVCFPVEETATCDKCGRTCRVPGLENYIGRTMRAKRS
jgi:uncharacterized protein with PIN domain